MNKKIRIIVILGVLCLLLAGYVIITNISDNGENEDNTITLSGISAEEMTSFSYQHYGDAEYGDELYTFVKESGIWYFEDDKDFPVSQRVAMAKAEIIGNITAERVVEENPDDIAHYGLDTPYLTVSVSDGEDTCTYHVGDYNASTMTYYIMQEGIDTIYLADADLFVAFDVQLWDMIEKETFPTLDVDTFKQMTFEFPDEQIILKNVKLEKDYIKSQWYLLDENAEVIENTDTIVTGQYPKLITALDFLREIDYRCDESEYSKYGFDNPALVITIDYEVDSEMKQLVLTIGSQTSENHIYEDYYVMTNQSEAVLTIEHSALETIASMDKNSMLSE